MEENQDESRLTSGMTMNFQTLQTVKLCPTNRWGYLIRFKTFFNFGNLRIKKYSKTTLKTKSSRAQLGLIWFDSETTLSSV